MTTSQTLGLVVLVIIAVVVLVYRWLNKPPVPDFMQARTVREAEHELNWLLQNPIDTWTGKWILHKAKWKRRRAGQKLLSMLKPLTAPKDKDARIKIGAVIIGINDQAGCYESQTQNPFTHSANYRALHYQFQILVHVMGNEGSMEVQKLANKLKAENKEMFIVSEFYNAYLNAREVLSEYADSDQ